MSLLGRLEDLSLTDIVQIVYLSRRTGVLEIIDHQGRHTVLFRHGLVVNASSPEHQDLVIWLEKNEGLAPGASRILRQMEDNGIPYGTTAIEMNMMSSTDLGNAIRNRILSVVTPLLVSREGEFNFILSETVSPLDIEYDPDVVFKEGGIAPPRLLGGEGEKIKPLRGLEESLKAGKALLRGNSPAEQTPALDLGLGHAMEPPADHRLPGTAPNPTDNVVPFPTREEEATVEPARERPAPKPEPSVNVPQQPVPTRTGQFKVSGGLIEVESPEATFRNVVLYERNPLVRVAAKRAFGRRGVKIHQYGSLDDVRTAMGDLFRANNFFVSFLELGDGEGPVKLLQQLKRKNPRLPVVIVDAEGDLRRRHDILKAGADLYLTKPSAARLQPGLAEEELTLFADELVLFAERSFDQWQQFAGGFDPQAGRRFYESGARENVDRTFSLLKQLINELSNPNDIGQVSSTILRLSEEYLERGILFQVKEGEFVGLGGFGAVPSGGDMDSRAKALHLSRNAPSLLADVASAGSAHRGKMRRTPVNVSLIESMGGSLPTEIVALPIMHSGRTIGILYGDNGEHRSPIDSMTGLEVFLSQAGYAFGNAVFASDKAGG